MAGYNQFSKSNNACDAELNGIYPLSLATKIVAKKYGFTQKIVKMWLEDNWGGEWHHYSKFYNEIKVYNTELDDDDLELLQVFAKEEKQKKKEPERKVEPEMFNCKIEWVEWAGTRRYPQAIPCDYSGQAYIKGDWIYFENQRKKISGNHLKYKIL